MTDTATICPKCGHANPGAATECLECGIVFENYQKSLVSFKNKIFKLASDALSENDFNQAKDLLNGLIAKFPELEGPVNAQLEKIAKKEIHFALDKIDNAIENRAISRAKKLISQFKINFPDLEDEMEEKVDRINFIIGEREIQKTNDLIRYGSKQKAKALLEYIEKNLASHALEARLLKKKLFDIEEAEKLKLDGELKAHIVRSTAVSVLRL